MSTVIHLADRAATIHVDTNPPWEQLTFADTAEQPILSYDTRRGWVLSTWVEHGNYVDDYEIGVIAPHDLNYRMAGFDEDPTPGWVEFADWLQQNPDELEHVLRLARELLGSRR